MKRYRFLLMLGAMLASMFVGACASGGGGPRPIPQPQPPIEQPPPPDWRNVITYVLDQASQPIVGATVSTAGQENRHSDGAGFVHFWMSSSAVYHFQKEGCEPADWDLSGRNAEGFEEPHRVHLTCGPPPAPEPQPGVHPRPVQGQLRMARDGRCMADDTGCRNFALIHVGDLPLRWHATYDFPDGPELRAAIEADMRAVAAENYTVARMWSHIKPGNGVWSRGGTPSYNGLDARVPEFVEREAELFRMLARNGMRGTLEAGGLDGIDSTQERTVMQRLHDAAMQAGAWMVAWASPVNEPSSVHGTSDDNGDVEPSYLRSLARILTGDTSMLWHLGHASNLVWDEPRERFSQKNYTPRDQPFGAYHAYRGQDARAKADHRFSWEYEAPGKWVWFWAEPEGVGGPVCGGSLRCVSATERGEEMNSPEAVAMIAGQQALRGLGGLMCGSGVQWYQPMSRCTGFREVAWTIAQLPDDVTTFDTIHHSGDVFRGTRVLAAVSIARVDGVQSRDGRFAYWIKASGGGRYTFPVEKSFSGRLCHPGLMTCEAVSKRAGDTLTVEFAFGRYFDGRIQ